MTLTRLDLDSAGCGAVGCTHTQHPSLFLHSKCHPSAGTWIEYRRDGLLRITCRKCKAHVAHVAVAPGVLS